MRIYFQLTANTEPVPYNYQPALVGAFHKWLGENELHDEISLYSLSWLRGGSMRKDKEGLDFKRGAVFSISSPLEDLHQQAVSGVFKDQDIRWGMRVAEVRLCPTPDFGAEHRFLAQSPILIKRNRPDGNGQQFYFPTDPEANEFLTDTLRWKLQKFGLNKSATVAFDQTYPSPKVKLVDYKGIQIKATQCPVIIKGDPQAVAFAWDVGVGNSTGIGFGAVR